MSNLPFQRVAVFGAGTMGHGIAQVAALAGYEVFLYDVSQHAVLAGHARIDQNLVRGIEKGKLTEEERTDALSRLQTSTDIQVAARDADLLVEAIPERLDLKQDLFRRLDDATHRNAILATNTSSISIQKISEATRDPSRVIGLHFFNPVYVMKLLEVVHHPGTDPAVLDTALAFGRSIDKECIVVKDMPGFATSRLGVALGMEAIRMVEDGVATPEDIDKAMVLGYRHPVGPLRLTDMVGLDVRMHIGEYLARELGNPAFEPPGLMREMVAKGQLGQKVGQGFYRW